MKNSAQETLDNGFEPIFYFLSLDSSFFFFKKKKKVERLNFVPEDHLQTSVRTHKPFPFNWSKTRDGC